MPLYPQTTVPTTTPYAMPQVPTVQYPPQSPAYSYQMARPIGISGRFVGSVSEITPSEIPMDGGYSIFPTNDLSAVYVKSWKPDGTIATLEFAPVTKKDADESKSDRLDLILEKLSKLEEQLG